MKPKINVNLSCEYASLECGDTFWCVEDLYMKTGLMSKDCGFYSVDLSSGKMITLDRDDTVIPVNTRIERA